MVSREADAVVIGAGINGMVAAAELADAGWPVVLVDAREKLGGFIASDELTIPGYVHDTFSSWHPLFVGGPAYGALGQALHQRGLEYVNADGTVTASVSERGVIVGLMLPVMAATVHGIGLPVVKGGAGQFVAAFERLLADRGVDVRLGAAAERIEVAGGRVVAVQVAGQRIVARKAVLASTSTGELYERLLAPEVAPPKGRFAARSRRPGRAAMQVHLALDRPLRWSDSSLDPVPLVHVCDGAGSTGIACAQAEAGLLPAEPTIVVGQQTLLDPSRAPSGAGIAWLQLQELPFVPRGDAAGAIDVADGWSQSVVEAYTNRVIDRIERFASGLRTSILGVHALPPTALLAENRNSVAGDPYGGAAELDQSLRWRPGTGTGHRTGVGGLWHIGAFTHPGPGLGGGSGHLVAQQLLTASRAPGRLLGRFRS